MSLSTSLPPYLPVAPGMSSASLSAGAPGLRGETRHMGRGGRWADVAHGQRRQMGGPGVNAAWWPRGLRERAERLGGFPWVGRAGQR